MSNYLGSLLTPAGIDAAKATAPDVLAYLQDMTRRYSAKAGDGIDRDDVASVAALLAPALLTEGHSASEAASVAVNRAIVAARRDAKASDAASIEGATTEDGTVLLRLVMPASIDPATRYGTTNRDRYRDALACLDREDAATADALLQQDGKGGAVPTAAVRRALGLPPVTGRAGVAATAALKADAARILPALQDAYRDILTEHRQGCEGWEPVRTYGLPRRRTPIDRAGIVADRTAKAPSSTRRTPSGNLPRIATEDTPRREDNRATSGPASAPRTVNRRALDRLGILDGSTRRRATEDDVRAALVPGPVTLPAYSPGAPAAKAERDALAFDVEAMVPANRGAARPLAGVTAGMSYGQGTVPAGTGTAPAKAKPGKSRTGSTGPTVPAGPRR